MRATQVITAALAATSLAKATDEGLTLFTFPEDSGLNGTVSIDPAAMAEMSDIASYTFPEGSGLNGTVSWTCAPSTRRWASSPPLLATPPTGPCP